MLKRLLFSALLFSLYLTLAAQPAQDSLLARQLQNYYTARYYSVMKENAPIYNGAEYTGHGQGIDGHPFFKSDEAFRGWIEYDGVLYQDILMKYDMIDQTVIISDFTSNYFIKLNSKKIRSFSLDNFEFVQPTLYNDAPEGFFQLLHRGDVSVLAKKIKQLKYSTNVEKTVYSFSQFNKYYIRYNSEYISVNGRNDLLKNLRDRRNELKKFISDNKLSYKRNAEEFLVKTVSYYNQLKTQR